VNGNAAGGAKSHLRILAKGESLVYD